MTQSLSGAQTVTLVVIAQSGRLQYEALLLAASLAASGTSARFRLHIAEPSPGPLWPNDPRITDADTRSLLQSLGATFVPFESRHFGHAYPYGNKIEALAALPANQPFLFLDTDTLILSPLDDVPFDFDRPGASLRREGTWPVPQLYKAGYTEIWKSLYDRFGLDFDSSLDPDQPDEYWRRYLYFNAGFFYHRCPHEFGQRFLDYALSVRDAPPPELAMQSLDPWLDQIVLPLVIHGLGGGRDALPEGFMDGRTTCHYRTVPLLYAREPDAVVTALEQIAAQDALAEQLYRYTPFQRMIYDGLGHKARQMFDRDDLPRKEQAIRNKLRREGLWMR